MGTLVKSGRNHCRTPLRSDKTPKVHIGSQSKVASMINGARNKLMLEKIMTSAMPDERTSLGKS